MPAFRDSTVLAPDGRPVLIAEGPAYRSAGAGRRFAGLMAPVDLGPNQALLPELPTLRARSRALYRSNPLIWGAIEKLVDNVVGWGLTPKSQHDREPVRRRIDTLWLDWSRQIGFDAIQKQVAREVMLAGECFVRIRPRLPSDRDRLGRRLLVPLEFQVLEAEHCPVWEDRVLESGTVRAGIQFDGIGRRVGYWMYPRHPGDGESYRRSTDMELRFVSAEQVIHLYDPESPAHVRGTPRLARTVLKAHDLDAFHDATLQRQAIAALFAGFIRRPDGGSGFLGETTATPEPTLEPGTLSYLGEGEDITFPSTPDVGANYAAFVKAMHLCLASGMGLTYEHVSNDLSQVNYSSIRAGAVEFRRGCEVWQYTVFVPQFLEAVWVAFLRRAQLTGALNVPGLLRDEVRAGRVEWISQGWEWVDPLKEVQAAKLEVEAGFETRTGVNARRGNDQGRIELQRAAEIERARELGLTFASDPVPEPTATPMPAPAVDPEDEDETDPEDEPLAARRAHV